MQRVLVRVAIGVMGGAMCVAALPTVAVAQGDVGRQVEVSVVGGSAHTSRVGRLASEQWLEPFAGVRADARLWRLGGGRVGLSAMADYFSFGERARVPEPCVGNCLLSSYAPPSRPLVDYRSNGGDLRLAVGATWQRPLVNALRAEVGGFAGARRARSETMVGDFGSVTSSEFRPMVGGEVGVSLQHGPLVSGVGFQFASSTMEGGVRRSQNRVALRMGWALP